MSAPRTLYAKLWDSHVIEDKGDGFALLYVDGHLLDEHSSAQAFDGLRASRRAVRRPKASLAVVDHNAPIVGDGNAQSLVQIAALERNARAFGVPVFSIGDPRQGISHVVGPEQGFILPGMTVVVGDSHASTHGALAALPFGIGTSEIEHVLASQTLIARRSSTMRITIEGGFPSGVSAKDLAMAIVGLIGTAGGNGSIIEYAGEAVRRMSMEARMTLSNMAIEAGAQAGLIAPDETTFRYLQGRPFAPQPPAWEQAIGFWRGLSSDPGAHFDREIVFDAGGLAPQVTWGTSPQDVISVDDCVPDPAHEPSLDRRRAMLRSLDYMGLRPGVPLVGTRIDKVFIGSCTNGRIEDLRAAASITRGHKLAPDVRGLVVPGSGLVKLQAEHEGLDRIFIAAGYEWRQPGCSMCLAMNEDRLQPGERCASTSNRNFEGRQGAGGRTHLMSPAMAAAAGLRGCIADVRGLAR